MAIRSFSLTRAFTLAILLSGCGNSLNCFINGDNLRGHIQLGPVSPVASSGKIQVEVSTDAFTSVDDTNYIDNLQKLPVVPYTVCSSTGKSLSVRAFVPRAGNSSYASGDPSGRYDGTSDGNAAYKTFTIPEPQPSATPAVDWQQKYNIDFVVDTTGGL